MIANLILVAIVGIPLSMFIAAIYMDYYDGIKMAYAPKPVDEEIEVLR